MSSGFSLFVLKSNYKKFLKFQSPLLLRKNGMQVGKLYHNNSTKQLLRTTSTLSTESTKNTSKKKEECKKPTNNKKGDYRRLFSLAKPEATKLAGAVGLLGVSSAVTLSVPFCMGKLIDLIQAASQKGVMDDTLIKMVAGLSTIFVIGGVANAGRVYLLQLSGVRIMKRLRESVYASIIGQEIAFFDSSKTGELINRLSSDTEIVSNSVTQNLSDGLRSLAQVSAGIGMMFYMSSQLASVVLFIVPPVAIIGIVYGRFVRNITTKTQSSLANSTHIAEEKISNIRTVRAFGQENTEINLYSEMVHRVQKFGEKEAIAKAIFYGSMGMSGNIIMLLVLYNGGLMMHSSQITVGNLSAFLLYAAYVGVAIGGLSRFYSEVNRSLGASARLWELKDRIPAVPISGGIIPSMSILQQDIEFKNVVFSYPVRSNRRIFNELNLLIKSGGITAVVGSSGSGKSTIASLLLRFYEPKGGTITIGDTNLNSLDPMWIRKNFGTVSQEPVLFSGTVRENILYGCSPDEISQDEILDAASKSNSLEFINSLPNQFDTVVGERGITLSGGQRQRIAIARALLKNPKILLLDEATSALDSESEHLVQEALERLMIGRTTLTIAHRLSTIKNADKIAVLGISDTETEGVVVIEQGSYSELMQITNGAFRKLVEQQTLHKS